MAIDLIVSSFSVIGIILIIVLLAISHRKNYAIKKYGYLIISLILIVMIVFDFAFDTYKFDKIKIVCESIPLIYFIYEGIRNFKKFKNISKEDYYKK